MARLLFEKQAIRTRRGPLAAGTVFVVYTDSAGTTLADISATVGGFSIAGSAVTVADIAGLGPSALLFYGPDGVDTLYLRCPSDSSLGVQEIEADEDERLDALEAGGGGGGIGAAIFDAKGDLIAATAADTAARLAVGTTGHELTSDPTATTGLRWVAPAAVNVKAPGFNAVGDGVATDTSALATAVGTANRRVYFPPGTYKTLQLTPASGTTLQGAGPTASQIDLVDDGTAASQTLFLNGVNDVTISDLYIQQSNAGGRTGVVGLIRVANCSRVKILRNRFGVSTSTAIWVGEGCEDVLIEGNTVAGTWADGIHVSRGARNVRIKHNKVFSTADDAIAVVGYVESPTNYPPCSDILIEGNHVDTPSGSARGIVVYGGVRVTVIDNTVIATPAAGIIVANVASGVLATRYSVDVDISHNRIYNAGTTAAATRSGIYVGSCRRLRVAHNTVDLAGGDGITGTGAVIEAKIVDNTVTRVAGRGIFFTQVATTDARLLAELYTDLGDTAPATASMRDLDVSGNQAWLNGLSAFAVLGEAALPADGLTLHDNQARDHFGGHAVSVQYVNGIDVAGGMLTGGNDSGLVLANCNNGTVHGLTVRSFGDDGILLQACTELVASANSSEGNIGFGIAEATSSTGNLLVANNVRNNTAGAINRVGATVRQNLGHATEASGTGTVASGSTSVAVSHGLAVTPAAKDIIVTSTNNPTNNVRHWVSAVGATTFTVTTSADPGASGLTFAWQAVIL